MGMSSSQARLLTLTARMHDIEYRAQRLEAQKLQLANQSNRVYDNYLNTLEANKIQYKLLQQDGTVTYRDASMNILQNGVIPDYSDEHSHDILFLQNQNGKIMVTPAVAEQFNLSENNLNMPMDDYITLVTGKEKVELPVYRTITVQDTDVIASFTPISNRVVKNPINNVTHTYTPVANTTGGIDYEVLNKFAAFDSTHSATSADSIQNHGSDLSGTYKVSSAADLVYLQSISNFTGKIILANDIDMSSVSDWSGITSFKGTFDGNGYTISNLTGSQGLFASTSGATIKNIGLENVNINSSAYYVGGLIGEATDTNVLNAYTTGTVKGGSRTGGLVGSSSIVNHHTVNFDNVYSTANVSSGLLNSSVPSDQSEKNRLGTGGLIGWSSVSPYNILNIKNAYAIGNVNGLVNVGGLIGYSYYDEDAHCVVNQSTGELISGDITDVVNCYAGGEVRGTKDVGGFVGYISYWGDGGDYCQIKDCSCSGNVIGTGANVGAFAGAIQIKLASGAGWDNDNQKYVNFISCAYSPNSGPQSAYGIILDENGNDQTILVTNSGSTDGLIEVNLAGSIPSIANGAYASNILGVLTKGGQFDACDESTEDVNAMKAKISAFLNLFQNNNADNQKLWYLNNAMYEYLSNSNSTNTALAEALYSDIMSGTRTATAQYQSGAELTGKVGRTDDQAWTPDGTHHVEKGEVDIPSLNTIADEVYYAMKMQDSTITLTNSDVRAWFSSKYNVNNASDKVTLANINNMISGGQDLTALFNAIKAASAKVDYSQKWSDTSSWDIKLSITDATVNFAYGTKEEQEFDHYEYQWDTTDPEIAQAMAIWYLAQKGVSIVTEEQANSTEYLKNIIEIGEAVLTTFNPGAIDELLKYTPEQIISMDESEYNDVMGIVNTSVATDTLVIESQNKKDLKRAEAEYEAKMKIINKKDRQYDTELSAVESERSAIKEEMDTLKSVIKENSELSFKLFS